MILVTGGAGYIGSHCVLALLEKNSEVVVFDNLSTGHIETVETLKKYGNLAFQNGDLLNFEDINSVFKKYNIEKVVHFAAFSQVGESVTNPQNYYINNVAGTLNLLKAMIENNVKKIVFSSTAATYGEPQYIPIDEKHPQTPINPYGQTKLMIEHIMDDYDKAYGLKSVFTGGKTFKMFGTDYDTKDVTCVRDYINIEDLINAHVLALNYLDNGGKTDFFNLGTTEGNTVKEVFDLCEKVTGQKIPVEICARRTGDPAKLVAENIKAKKILKWEPKNTLKESINTAYKWEKKANNV